MVTNFEKIKEMDTEELGNFIRRLLDDNSDDWISIGYTDCMDYKTHHWRDEDGSCKKCEYYNVGTDYKKWLETENNNDEI